MTTRRARASLFLTNQQPPGTDQLSALEGQLQLCRAARDGEWASIIVGQHHLSEGLTHLQPVPFLARVAAEAGDLRLGVGVSLLALHNPVDIAETYASLDVVCGGRLIFGVGLGYREVEYAAFGLQVADRVPRLEANLRIVLALWRGEEVTVDLPWCRLDRQRLNLLPVHESGPPLWMAANSDGAVRRAGRLADAWMINPHATKATIARQLGLYREARIDAGRSESPPELPAMREVFCARTREEAVRAAAPFLGAKYKVYASWGQDKVLPGNEDFTAPFGELQSDRFIVGSPEDCLAQLLPWRDELGVDHFVIRTDWAGMPPEVSLESMRLLTDEVLPVLCTG